MDDTFSEKITFVARKEEGPSVYTYTFTSKTPIPFSAGQYVHMRIPSMPEDVRRVREFSFASAPHETMLLFGIDARSGSDYQQALKNLEVGETVELFKIRGHMTWPSLQTHVVMIASGVGITPFRSMILDAREKQYPIQITLIHVSREPYMYCDEIEPSVDAYIPTTRDGIASVLAQVSGQHKDTQYYLAGGAGFVSMCEQELRQSGIENIECDVFKGIAEDV